MRPPSNGGHRKRLNRRREDRVASGIPLPIPLAITVYADIRAFARATFDALSIKLIEAGVDCHEIRRRASHLRDRFTNTRRIPGFFSSYHGDEPFKKA